MANHVSNMIHHMRSDIYIDILSINPTYSCMVLPGALQDIKKSRPWTVVTLVLSYQGCRIVKYKSLDILNACVDEIQS